MKFDDDAKASELPTLKKNLIKLSKYLRETTDRDFYYCQFDTTRDFEGYLNCGDISKFVGSFGKISLE